MVFDGTWFVHIAFLIAIGVSVFSVIGFLTYKPFLYLTANFTPASRLIMLRGYIFMPLIGGLVLAAMAKAPSIFHDTGLPIDHCHNEFGCFGREQNHIPTSTELLVLLVLLSCFALPFIRMVGHKHRSDKLVKNILTHSTQLDGRKAQVIETPEVFAFSVGYLKPIIVISRGLLHTLDAKQVDIVLAHEHAHTHHKDNLMKQISRIAACLHTPWCRKALLEHHNLCLELRADQQTQGDHWSNLDVAQTILNVHKASRRFKNNDLSLVVSFLGHAVEKRVEALLEEHPQKHLGHLTITMLVVTALFLASLTAVPYHNFLERLFQTLP
ncbi:M56 family metallopeptidase [Terasakiella pusilla]|uniref:M56 family metallopeptidase n=1 Tax=Terasakiella pusilla TaxID=64973 RepID=UPI003AA95FCC